MAETMIAFNGAFLRHPHSGMGDYTRNLLDSLYSHNYLSGAPVLVPEETLPEDLVPGWAYSYRGHLTPLRERHEFEHKIVLEFLKTTKPRIFHSMYASLPICDLPIRKIVTVGDMIPRLAWRYGSFYQAIKSNIALMRNRFLPLISRSLNERGIKTADAILTFSECSKQDIVELLGVGQEKVYVVPISVDRKLRPEPSNVVSSILEKYNIITSYILHVGGFAPHKNVINLIEAYNLLSTNSKRSTKLVIVGSCPPPRIINRIAQLGLTNNILFVSGVKRDHRSALYSGAKMLVYPSLYEGFGLPPLEAMSCGCPVITSNTSSIPEVVGNAAITVNPNDSIAISKAIELILNDGRVAADLREQGLERAQRFSWDHCVAETCRIYDQLLSS